MGEIRAGKEGSLEGLLSGGRKKWGKIRNYFLIPASSAFIFAKLVGPVKMRIPLWYAFSSVESSQITPGLSHRPQINAVLGYPIG
jgi:hypothetical protein